MMHIYYNQIRYNREEVKEDFDNGHLFIPAVCSWNKKELSEEIRSVRSESSGKFCERFAQLGKMSLKSTTLYIYVKLLYQFGYNE